MTGGIILTRVTHHGKIREGDALLIFDGEKLIAAEAKKVLNSGTYKEEVVIDEELNKYFIVDWAGLGESWAKEVYMARRKNKD